MTRAELIESLASQFIEQNNPKDVDAAVREIFEIMIETLSSGQRIEIRGFGSFEIRVREPRVAHNPKTGEQVSLSQRRVVHFKPGVELRDRVNVVNK
ncbi:MAG TPA: integration host factor subunit beta [Succinivibrionaceae bacterium]|nr:integration host factor subunit beta [Succinivibrio sp.]HAR79371.1 integration host factor subunit beta [Succinivibrionaceae bacterium]